METFAFASAVRGYHVYKDVWKPSIGEKLVAKREFKRTTGEQDSSIEPVDANKRRL